MNLDLGARQRQLQRLRNLFVRHPVLRAHQQRGAIDFRQETKRAQHRRQRALMFDACVLARSARWQRISQLDVAGGPRPLLEVQVSPIVNKYAFTVASRMGDAELHTRRNVSDVISSASAGSQERYSANRCTSSAYRVYSSWKSVIAVEDTRQPLESYLRGLDKDARLQLHTGRTGALPVMRGAPRRPRRMSVRVRSGER